MIGRYSLWGKSRVLKTGRHAPPWIKPFRNTVYGLSFVALLFLVLESGLQWQLPRWLQIASTILDYLVFIAFLIDAGLTFAYTFPRIRYFKTNWMDILVFLPLVLNIISIQTGAGLIVVRNIIVIASLFTRSRKFSRVLRRIRLNTPRIVALSFMTTILLGTILLTFPTATEDGKGSDFVDALFTATSATCVTGLIVQDTPVYFSTFGEAVILILIQLGGLGIMTYSAFIALLFGRFSFVQRKTAQEMLEEDQNVMSMILYIFKMTLAFEFVGVILLFLRWVFIFDSPGHALWLSLFHSVSAFCNAGFSLFSNSLENFTSDPLINFSILSLILFGGIGFYVVHDIINRIRGVNKRLSLHSKLAISVSVVLIVLGFFIVFFFEFGGVLLHENIGTKLCASLFQSITTRTAGFNTLNISAFSNVTLTFFIILMFIGASPGSTGGGIKTTTFAILLISVKTLFQRKEHVEVFGRTIPYSGLLKAFTLMISALVLIFLIFSLLLTIENKPYIDLLFETVSAFGTVGLSTGITPELTTAGKLLITLLMYLGRIGPLTFGLALAGRIRKGNVLYPEARVIIG